MEFGDRFLREELGLRQAKPQNTSQRVNYRDYFTLSSYSLINRLYQDDFDRMGFVRH